MLKYDITKMSCFMRMYGHKAIKLLRFLTHLWKQTLWTTVVKACLWGSGSMLSCKIFRGVSCSVRMSTCNIIKMSCSYKDWPMQVTKLSHFATIHELEISGMLVFSTIRRWKITEVSHFTRISGCESTKLSHSMRIGERNVTNMERVVCIIECMLSEERAAK